MIRKVVILAAGLGTRLLPYTKVHRKEMMPIFAKDTYGNLILKPHLQLVFEQYYDFGIREFCFIVGKGKKAIKDHFTCDYEHVARLRGDGKHIQAQVLKEFYDKICQCTLLWVNQRIPLGCGNAILKAQSHIVDEPFLVHAGDTYIISSSNDHLKRLVGEHRGKNQAVLMLQEIRDTQQRNVAQAAAYGSALIIKRLLKEPAHTSKNLAIIPIYAFNPSIFEALKETECDEMGEIRIEKGVQKLIDGGYQVRAIKLTRDELRLDIGTPTAYWQTMALVYKYLSGDSLNRRDSF